MRMQILGWHDHNLMSYDETFRKVDSNSQMLTVSGTIVDKIMAI